MASSRLPYLDCTVSRSRKRAIRKASVAPVVDAIEASTVPRPRPKMAPAVNVRMAAPGNDNAVTAI